MANETGFADITDETSTASAVRKYSAHRRWVDTYTEKAVPKAKTICKSCRYGE